jgi:bacteriocin-like protein
MYFSDEQERTMRNQETTIVLDSIPPQSKADTTNTHIELSKEELDKITGGGGPPTTVVDYAHRGQGQDPRDIFGA